MSQVEEFEKKAAHLVGRYVLIGISNCDKDENVLSTRQVHGTIKSVKGGIITMELAGTNAGREFTLPPDVNIFEKADPDIIYRLRSTGEEVTGVEYTAAWMRISQDGRTSTESGEDDAPGLSAGADRPQKRGVMRRRMILSGAAAIALVLLYPLGFLSNSVSAIRCENDTARHCACGRFPLTCPVEYDDAFSGSHGRYYSQAYSMEIFRRVGVPTVAETPKRPLAHPWAQVCKARSLGPFLIEVDYDWCAEPLVGGGGERTYFCVFGVIFELDNKVDWVT